MKYIPIILFLIAVVFLLALFFFPMWKIVLIAPQYPDGVTLYIWIDKLGGESPSTLQNINILNHYIGMKSIEPDSIPELRFMKYVVMGLIALGIAIGLIGKHRGYLLWTILLVIVCAVGMYDFYLWEYDYGHNLSPTAPIKIPGMVYQPPLIGQKYLLNFLAKSYPHIGGWFVCGSIVLGFLAFWIGNIKARN